MFFFFDLSTCILIFIYFSISIYVYYMLCHRIMLLPLLLFYFLFYVLLPHFCVLKYVPQYIFDIVLLNIFYRSCHNHWYVQIPFRWKLTLCTNAIIMTEYSMWIISYLYQKYRISRVGTQKIPAISDVIPNLFWMLIFFDFLQLHVSCFRKQLEKITVLFNESRIFIFLKRM